MNHQRFYTQLKDFLVGRCPRLSALAPDWDLTKTFSPHLLELPMSALERAKAAIKAIYQVSRRPAYLEKVRATHRWAVDAPATDGAALMAYDFHTTADGDARLIEINTNASAYLLAEALYATHGLPPAASSQPPLTGLRETFFRESGTSGEADLRVAIVDVDPPRQAMWPEFLLYEQLFSSWGWAPQILAPKDLAWKDHGVVGPDGHRIDFVYNRTTDFYLSDSHSLPLRQAFLSRASTVSPHPREYALLADKERLMDLATSGWLESLGASAEQCAAIRAVLIPARPVRAFSDPQQLWADRRKYFFKPVNSFGGKGAYRGASVSRKVFERILSEDYLVQDFVPAPSWPVQDQKDPLSHWKFDLRLFVDRDQVQMAVARSYLGQVTNFSTPMGGLTAIRFRT